MTLSLTLSIFSVRISRTRSIYKDRRQASFIPALLAVGEWQSAKGRIDLGYRIPFGF
jgi:hypothetical protein